MIRVLVVDDHPLVRAGLERLIDKAPDMEIAGAARDGAEAIALAAARDPDVILMDLSMPVLDGASATRRIRAAGTRARVVVLTSFSDRDRILDALDAGAVGYLLKDVAPDELLRGIRVAHDGESPLAPKAASAVLERAANGRPAFTPRELEVLKLLAAGLPNKAIAAELGIRQQTVKAHLTSIFGQLGVSDRTSAALWAQRHGLADPGADD